LEAIKFDTDEKKDSALETGEFVSMPPIPVRLMEKAHKETKHGYIDPEGFRRLPSSTLGWNRGGGRIGRCK
jgi:hypothetical protein